MSSDVEREETQVREEVDSISLQGVEGERALPTGSGELQQLLCSTEHVFQRKSVSERTGFEPAFCPRHSQLVSWALA